MIIDISLISNDSQIPEPRRVLMTGNSSQPEVSLEPSDSGAREEISMVGNFGLGVVLPLLTFSLFIVFP